MENREKKYRIAVVTATRAEYGLLTPLIRRIDQDAELELDLIVTGGHLADRQGHTIDAIIGDGFPIAHRIPILEDGDTPYDISVTMANAIKGFARCFRDDRPDMAVILGDRTEMLGVAGAAMNEKIPIAHIHGGEVTEGAVDDSVRHALTKMSYLHFTATDVYRRRVIQLGEAPERVFNVGSLGAENIRTAGLLEEESIRRVLGVDDVRPYVVVTFHPVTLDTEDARKQAEELCLAMAERGGYFYIITLSNADAGGDGINAAFRDFADRLDNIKTIYSLGMNRYLSAVKYAAFVLGNSSSGMLEAPVLGTPTVNIGDRQKGRLMAGTIVNCAPRCKDIVEAMDKAKGMEHIQSSLYGDGSTSEKIMEVIRRTLYNHSINLKKGFNDWEFQV